MGAAEGKVQIDEEGGKEMGGPGQGASIGRTGENMRDESHFQGLNRKCVSINMLHLALADHTLALGDHETQYRPMSHDG